MSKTFHRDDGLYIAGVDWHAGFHIFPPFPCMFYSATFAHPFSRCDDAEPTVLMDGQRAAQDQYKSRELWPHIGFIPDPLDALCWLHTLTGVHQTWLPRLQVLIAGKPGAPTAVTRTFSVNQNCHEFGKLPTNLVRQTGTVQTTPTWADYRYGGTRAAIEFAIDFVMFVVTGGRGGAASATSAIGDQAQDKLAQQFRRVVAQQVWEETLEATGRASVEQVAAREVTERIIRDQIVDRLIKAPELSVRDAVQDVLNLDDAALDLGLRATGLDPLEHDEWRPDLSGLLPDGHLGDALPLVDNLSESIGLDDAIDAAHEAIGFDELSDGVGDWIYGGIESVLNPP